MRRVVSVWFPTLPTDRLRQPKEGQGATHPLTGSKGHRPFAGPGQRPDLPLVTVTSRVVMAVDATAAALGLRPGMKLAQAQALVPGLKVYDADLPGDAALLRRLAEWCLRYAPLAAVDPPDGLWIDVTGGTHLHGGRRGCYTIWSVN